MGAKPELLQGEVSQGSQLALEIAEQLIQGFLEALVQEQGMNDTSGERTHEQSTVALG